MFATDVDSEEETYTYRGSSTRNVQTKVFDIKTTTGKSYPGEALAQENSDSDESSDEDGFETEDTVPCPSTSSRAMTKHAAAEKVDVEVIDGEASGYVNAQIHAEKKAAARAPAPAPVAVSPEDRAATSPEDRTVARPRWRIPQSDKEQSAEDARRLAQRVKDKEKEEREKAQRVKDEKVPREHALHEMADAEKAQHEKEPVAANQAKTTKDKAAAEAKKAEIHAEKKAAVRPAAPAPAAASLKDRAAASPEDQSMARKGYRIRKTQPKPHSAPTSPPQDSLRPLGHRVHGDVGALNAPPRATATKLLANKPLAEPPAKPLQPPLQPVPAPVPAAVPPRSYLAECDPRLPARERPVTATMPEGGFGPAPFQPSTPPETKPSGWGPRPPNSDGALRSPELLPNAEALASHAAVASAAAAAAERFRTGGAATHEKAPVRSLSARDEILRERNDRDKQRRVRACEAEEPARKRPRCDPRGQPLRWETKRPRQHEYERGGRCQRDDDTRRRESDLTLRELLLERNETKLEYERALHRQKQSRYDDDASRRESAFRLREARLKFDKAEFEYERALHHQQQSRPARDDRDHRGNGYCGRTFKR